MHENRRCRGPKRKGYHPTRDDEKRDNRQIRSVRVMRNISQETRMACQEFSRNQIIIDREHFNPAISYSIAKQVFWKKFGRNPVAQTIKDDLIQEAVALMVMQSGRVKENANERYNDKYGFWWAAYNGMLAYLTK